MVIAIASDHAGYGLRQIVIEYLQKQGHSILEFGALSKDEPFSYVKAGRSVAEAVSLKKADRGIVICGTGLGISMVCNKHRGIRCAVCTDEFMARMSREHNDANVLSLGARVIGSGLALTIVEAFLHTDFEANGRHQVRVEEIGEVESLYFKD